MDFFRNLFIIAALIGSIFAGYIHLLSRTVIPSIPDIANELNSPIFAMTKLDLTEQGQFNLIKSILNKNHLEALKEHKRKIEEGKQSVEPINRMELILKLLGFSTPLYFAICYKPNQTNYLSNTPKNFNSDDFIFVLFIGRGQNLINYYLSTAYIATAIPRLQNANIFMSTNDDDSIIGMIENVIIIGSSLSQVKNSLFAIDKAISPKLDSSKGNMFFSELQTLDNSKLGGLVTNIKVVKPLIKNLLTKVEFEQKVSLKNELNKLINNASLLTINLILEENGSLHVIIKILGKKLDESILLKKVILNRAHSSNLNFISSRFTHSKIEIEYQWHDFNERIVKALRTKLNFPI